MKPFSALKTKLVRTPAPSPTKHSRQAKGLVPAPSTPAQGRRTMPRVTLGSPVPYLGAPSPSRKEVARLSETGLKLLTHPDLALHGLHKGLIDNLRFSRADAVERVGAKLNELIAAANRLPVAIPAERKKQSELSDELASIKQLTTQARVLVQEHIVSSELSQPIMEFLSSVDGACNETIRQLTLLSQSEDDLDALMSEIERMPDALSAPASQHRTSVATERVSKAPASEDEQLDELFSSITKLPSVSPKRLQVSYVGRSVPAITAEEYGLKWQAFLEPVPPALRSRVEAALRESRAAGLPHWSGSQLISARNERISEALAALDRKVDELKTHKNTSGRHQAVAAIRQLMLKLQDALKDAGFHEEASHIGLARLNPAGYNAGYGQGLSLSQAVSRQLDSKEEMSPGSARKKPKLVRQNTPSSPLPQLRRNRS